ncbi:MAG: hypothetical protein JST12_14730 [Armatimonadetes bacterium]|nr:hypothetical protein [Armatimonadota bacterium]
MAAKKDSKMTELELLAQVAEKQSGDLADLETLYLNEEATFPVVLPHGATIMFRSIMGHGALKQFERKRDEYASKMMGGKRQGDFVDSLALEPDAKKEFGAIISSRTIEDFRAAYVIHNLNLEPGYSEADAIRMTRMGKLVTIILDQVDANLMKATTVAWNSVLEQAKND